MKKARLAFLVSFLALPFFPGRVLAQTDPGVQRANRGTGKTLSSAADSTNFTDFFSGRSQAVPGRRVGFQQPDQQQRSGAAV